MAPNWKPRPKLLDKRERAKKKLRAWIGLRQRVFLRDQGVCVVCLKPARRPEAHHLLSRALGGKDEIDNLVTVCKTPCHEEITGHVVRVRWRDDRNRAGTLRIERVS